MATMQVEQDLRELAQERKLAVVNEVKAILESYQREKADLIPILQAVQGKLGYLPQEGLKQIAKFIDIPESTVYGVATFYAQFKLTPVGRNIIKVCLGTGCYVRGATKIIDELESELGIKAGETTSDLEYTLETVACFGSCALAPVVVFNDKVYGRMTPEKAKEMLKSKTSALGQSKEKQSA
jgi:NADH-quinone oxidoreductase subunit E